MVKKNVGQSLHKKGNGKMKTIDLGNGLFLNLETGTTNEDFNLFNERKEERRKTERRNGKTLNVFSGIEERRIEERRKTERRINKPFDRPLPTKEEIDYFLKRDGYYIH